MLKLLLSAFRRIVTAVTNPFRMLIVRIQRMFNINVITAKLVRPLTKKVKALITLRPQTREDYFVIGRWWIYKKLFLTLLLALCAGVFIYFTMFAPKLPAAMATAASVETDVYFNYDDMKLREFTGVANIRAADGSVVYTGDVDKGVCTGNGTLRDRKGRLEYRGGFEQNQFSGQGIYYYPDGKKKYEGQWAKNLYQGEGVLYAEDGVTQLYAGQFANGLYEGEGKAWSASGVLLYEGGFSGGRYHGQGVSYYPDGTAKYKGEFLKGLPQGKGELYSETGKRLYTGDVYQGKINYRALTDYNFAEIKAAFAETPRVFYTDTDSAFLFEQAGVVVTTDCRVRVDTWVRPAEQRDGGAYYYMPGQYGEASSGELYESDGTSPPDDSSGWWAAPDASSQAEEEPPALESLLPPEGGEQLAALPAAPEAARLTALRVFPAGPPATQVLLSPVGSPLARQMSWYVAEDNEGTYAPPSTDGSSASSDGASSGGASSESAPGSGSSGPELHEDAGTAASSAPEPQASPYPDFVEKAQTLYFEIDTNVWQAEDTLDAEKVRVRKVTVYTGDIPAPPEGAVEYEDDSPVGLEDCVAIDLLRQKLPTSFPQIRFEADRQNRLFVRLWNLDFASRIDRRAYLSGDLTYRYAYQDPDDETPLYFSVER
ncbi:MORN repeat-containing protein [Anaerotruncus massiliensis (ex Togo et al. 2019)]|uniref:MORN repeat-containing protein n=1 Tax=Anaerotruncus TaxID=244127 RepID=UPI000C786524|nr:hypothetical protein [Anaerotruncus massiliensis (ex Togo et al. 2019)]